MPNWCNNSITITGPKDKIKQLWEGATAEGDNAGLLNTMVPMPEQLNDTTSPTPPDSEQPMVDGVTNWYDWRVNNWGTKWEVSSEGLELSDDGTEITGWFDSAWAPPLTAFQTYIEQNDDVNITCYYEEGGMDFAGKWEDGDDQYIDDIHGKVVEYIKTGEYPDDELFREIDEWFDLVEQRRDYIEEELAEELAEEEETKDA